MRYDFFVHVDFPDEANIHRHNFWAYQYEVGTRMNRSQMAISIDGGVLLGK